MDRFPVNPRPKPSPKPKPKPTNLMEEVISIKHDEGVVENPCLYRVAREWAARLEVSQMVSPSPGPRLNGSLSQKLSWPRIRCRLGSSRTTSSRAVGPSRNRGATGGETRGFVARPFGADGPATGAQVCEAAAQTLEEKSMESARQMRALDPKLPAKAGQNQQRLRGAKNDPESLTDKGGPLGRRPFFRAGCSKVISWAQQREAIRIAAEAGVRARTSAAGSETLPFRHHHLRYAMLSRPNGEPTTN